MQDRILKDLGKLVLDHRRPPFPPAFYSSKRYRVDLNTTGYRKPVRPNSLLLEPPQFALYTVGHAADQRLNEMLSTLHIPMQAVYRCVLHCKLSINKYEVPPLPITFDTCPLLGHSCVCQRLIKRHACAPWLSGVLICLAHWQGFCWCSMGRHSGSHAR